MPEPEYIDPNRDTKGHANWKENYDEIYQSYNNMLFSYRNQKTLTISLIENLINLILDYKSNKDYTSADKIKQILISNEIELQEGKDEVIYQRFNIIGKVRKRNI